METRRDDKAQEEPRDDADHEQREYSSPACYLHEFEQQASGVVQTRKAPEPAADSVVAK